VDKLFLFQKVIVDLRAGNTAVGTQQLYRSSFICHSYSTSLFIYLVCKQLWRSLDTREDKRTRASPHCRMIGEQGCNPRSSRKDLQLAWLRKFQAVVHHPHTKRIHSKRRIRKTKFISYPSCCVFIVFFLISR